VTQITTVKRQGGSGAGQQLLLLLQRHVLQRQRQLPGLQLQQQRR
jgi:hypothetical protein